MAILSFCYALKFLFDDLYREILSQNSIIQIFCSCFSSLLPNDTTKKDLRFTFEDKHLTAEGEAAFQEASENDQERVLVRKLESIFLEIFFSESAYQNLR